MNRTHSYFVAFILLLTVGCIEPPNRKIGKAFSTVQLESCLAVMIDMSGSFHSSWEDRAHKLFMQLLDEVFATGSGTECRVVLGQLSGTEPIVLFEGTPSELRRKFRSPEDLNEFLKSNSDASSSRVFQSTQLLVDYVSSLNGVGDDTRLITVVLSDMNDNETNEDKRKAMLEDTVVSLADYRKKNGALALYFVAQDQAKVWRDILDQAGFKPGEFVIETSLVESPQLPQLD